MEGTGAEGSAPQMYILCHIRKVSVCILYIFTVKIIHHYYAARIVGRNVKMFYQYNEKISVFLWFWEVFIHKKTPPKPPTFCWWYIFLPIIFLFRTSVFCCNFWNTFPTHGGKDPHKYLDEWSSDWNQNSLNQNAKSKVKSWAAQNRTLNNTTVKQILHR